MAVATKAKKSGADATQVTIPELKMGQLVVHIEGTTPLIMNRFSETAMSDLAARQSGAAKVKKSGRVPEDEFDAALYRDEDGDYAFPSIGIKRAMVNAGQRFADEKATELNGAFSISGEMVKLCNFDEPTMRADRVILSGIGRTSSIAYRPQFVRWAMEPIIHFNMDFISPDQIVNLLRLAGFSVGIGGWRVEKKGSFGQFRVTSVRAVETANA